MDKFVYVIIEYTDSDDELSYETYGVFDNITDARVAMVRRFDKKAAILTEQYPNNVDDDNCGYDWQCISGENYDSEGKFVYDIKIQKREVQNG